MNLGSVGLCGGDDPGWWPSSEIVFPTVMFSTDRIGGEYDREFLFPDVNFDLVSTTETRRLDTVSAGLKGGSRISPVNLSGLLKE